MTAFPFLTGRRVLITGATGLFGRALVDRLLGMGVQLRTTSRRSPPPDFPIDRAEHLVGDLADQSFARRATKDMHGLFHLAGRRGSLGIQRRQAATMLGENLMICLTTLAAARHSGVERILYASTVTVYPHMEVYREELAWSGNPHPANEYAAWAKRIAEKYVEAQELEYGLKNTAIIRPVNTFGPHDDFAPETALVVPALIGRAMSGEIPVHGLGRRLGRARPSLCVGCRRRHAARLREGCRPRRLQYRQRARLQHPRGGRRGPQGDRPRRRGQLGHDQAHGRGPQGR